jgi:hypothetical protein
MKSYFVRNLEIKGRIARGLVAAVLIFAAIAAFPFSVPLGLLLLATGLFVLFDRRDLRVTDNTALHHTCCEAGEVVPVYILSTWKRNHRWTGPNRQEFLCGCLESLAKNLEHLGKRPGSTIWLTGRRVNQNGSRDQCAMHLL